MRFDQLGPGERDLLRHASIAGTSFGEDALLALLPEIGRRYVPRLLHSLQQKRLIQPAGNGSYKFGHVLVQLTAYHSMTLHDRAVLHERLAGWFADQASEEPLELHDLVTHHRNRATEHEQAIGSTRQIT